MSFNTFEVINQPTTINHLSINLRKGHINAVVGGIDFIDKDTLQHVSYIPSFEISGYGETPEKAQEMLKAALHDLFEYLTDLKQEKLNAELKRYGWMKNKYFNKQYSNSFVDENGALRNFNVKENSVSRITLTAA